jgi:hypothetical protein
MASAQTFKGVMMDSQKRISSLVILTLVLSLAIVPVRANSETPRTATAYWLGGVDPVVVTAWQKSGRKQGPNDFMALFESDSPWRQASSKVSVFKIAMQFAAYSSDADLKALISGLQNRGIKLAIEMGMLQNDRGCGKGEGYMPPAHAMQRIKSLGGQGDFVAIDEVVFFGRERYWPEKQGPACKDTLEEVAREVAGNAVVIHQYFPQAQIGDVEPITSNQNFNPIQLAKDYSLFGDLFRSKTGSNLAFIHTDIAWRSKNWLPGIAPLKAVMHTRGIRFGIIIGGTPDQTDNLSWTRAGLGQLQSLAAHPMTVPEDIIVQS